MMLAGILSQKTQRPVKALHGGLDAYWQETELKRAVKAVPLPAAGAAHPQASPAPPASGPSAPATRKKKSAGC
jgi:hypothetical protein